MLFCRRSLHPRPSKKSERKRPSFYTNPIAPHSSIRSGQVIIAMEELQDGAVPEGDYEEPEDEVQEVGGELSVGSLSNDVFLDRNRKWTFFTPCQTAILNKFLGKSSLLLFFLFNFFYNNVIAFWFLPIAQAMIFSTLHNFLSYFRSSPTLPMTVSPTNMASLTFLWQMRTKMNLLRPNQIKIENGKVRKFRRTLSPSRSP